VSILKGANLVLRFLLELCPGRPLLLGLQNRNRTDIEGRAGNRRPARSRGPLGDFRGSGRSGIGARSAAFAPEAGGIRRRGGRAVIRQASWACLGAGVGLRDQPCPDVRVGPVMPKPGGQAPRAGSGSKD
jgi:hypothetical protein